MAGIYVHIPFCGQFCTYCNFYSVKGKGYREKYISALHNEIENRKEFFTNTGVSPQTIYFGGGTPSVFTPVQLGEVLEHIKRVYEVSPVEVSIEVNPNDITPGYAAGLRKAGFNRVSMGIQSFVDEHLQWMNRRHKADEGEQAYRNLRDAGFENISLDLIFGYGGLTPQLWEYNLSRMVDLFPEHISAYQMSIEPGSALGKMYEKGEYDLPPDSLCHQQYSFLQKYLSGKGYVQYEVSNFARKRGDSGEIVKSLHNSSYWTKEPYLGLGPAAHSYNGKIRSWNHSSVTKYCRYYLQENAGSQSCSGNEQGLADITVRCGAGVIVPSQVGGYEELGARDVFNETVMLGLRRVEGVDLGLLDPVLLKEVKGDIARHCRLGNLVMDGGKIRIPYEHLFVSDGIIRDLFV
ncbi:MAG: radical SAM family heme chaperone HemW [Bacteroidales bacterium]|nr:radical SAM family heme chaperone HemW [Bacteroidales bacterium]